MRKIKGRFDESVEENMESVCNTEQVNGQAKNDLVTDPEARNNECDQSKDDVSQSVESLLVSSPVPEVKPPRNTNPGKPAAILFCNWAKADDDADGEESESESSEGFSEDSDNDSPETKESLEPTLEDTVA